jgi:hypothetical protein
MPCKRCIEAMRVKLSQSWHGSECGMTINQANLHDAPSLAAAEPLLIDRGALFLQTHGDRRGSGRR